MSQEGASYSNSYDGDIWANCSPNTQHSTKEGYQHFPHLGWPMEHRNDSSLGTGSSSFQVFLFCFRLLK